MSDHAMQPRDYQDYAVKSLFAYFEQKSGNPLVALPTATGKSVVIALFCYRAIWLYPVTRIGVFTHVKELVQQNFEKLVKAWPQAPAGIFSAGLRRKDFNSQILFGGIKTVANALDQLGWFDIIIVDECHLVSPDDETTYQKVFNFLRTINPHLKIIGTTATWWRSKTGSLIHDGSLFTDICYDATTPAHFREFINRGYLSPLVPRATHTQLDLTGVGVTAGDYNQKQLEIAVDKSDITHAALSELIAAAAGRRAWLIFCSGIDHAVNCANLLNAWGIKTGVVHSKMGASQRDETLRRWYSGELRAVTNNNVLTTGIDYPAIDLIGMLRPTQSSSLWVQMLGRGMRPSPGKVNCLVLDFARNTVRLGPVDDPRIPGRKGPGGGGDMPVKICELCGCYNHISKRACDYCGADFPESDNKFETTASELPLMSSDLPVYERFAVNSVSYAAHNSKAGNNSIKVTYQCGVRRFTEYVGLEGKNFELYNARNWWRKRALSEPPATVEEALQHTSELRSPRVIQVWLNTKYPEVVDAEW